MYKRILKLNNILERKSLFFLGPRQTGKSTFLQTEYPDALYINLLSKSVYDFYLSKKNALESDLELFGRTNKSSLVIIDEIQKLPALLDEVHNQIEKNKNLRFILTGSSARKLKRNQVNLLGGRASWRNLFPLVYPEISNQLKTLEDLERRLLVGGLPYVFDSKAPFEDLDDYLNLYLKEEIRAEGLARNYEAFNRFLSTAALSNAEQINYTKLGSDSEIPPRTIHDYFEIIKDTLIGYILPPFKKTISRKPVSSSKFYLFDTGVANALLGRRDLHLGTPEAGSIFEQYLILEILAFNSYFNKRAELYYWRSTSMFEVDLIIKTASNKIISLEIKSKKTAKSYDFKGLLAFAEDCPTAKSILVTLQDRHHIDESGVEVMDVLTFLKILWNEELF